MRTWAASAQRAARSQYSFTLYFVRDDVREWLATRSYSVMAGRNSSSSAWRSAASLKQPFAVLGDMSSTQGGAFDWTHAAASSCAYHSPARSKLSHAFRRSPDSFK